MGRLALGLIGLVALGLRVWGIGFGLPELFHPDEPAYVLQALAVGGGLPGGLTFADPPLFKYLLLLEYAGAYAIARLTGVASSQAAFLEQFRTDPTLLYLMARLTSAVAGAATAVAAALLGRALAGDRVGLIAGGLSAVAYLLVRDAHFGVNDSLVTLLVTLGLIACVQIARRGRRRDYVAAGVLAGLAFAAKYDGIALLAPLVLAHIVRVRGTRESRTDDPQGGAATAAGASGLRLTSRAQFSAKLMQWWRSPVPVTMGPRAGLRVQPGVHGSEARPYVDGVEMPVANASLMAGQAQGVRRKTAASGQLAAPEAAAPIPTGSRAINASAEPNATLVRANWHFASIDLALACAACLVAAVLVFPSLVTEPARVFNDIYVHLYLEATGGYDGLDPSGGYVFYARTLVAALGWPLLLTSAAGIVLGVLRRDAATLVVAALPAATLGVLGSQQLYFARFALPVLPALIVLAALALDALLSRHLIAGALALLVVATPTGIDALRFDVLLLQTDTRTLARQWITANLPPEATFAADAPPLGPSLLADRNVARDEAALFDASLDDYHARGAQYVVVSSFTAEAHAVDPNREAQRVAFNAELGLEGSVVARFEPYAGNEEPPFEYDAIYGPYSHLDRLERPGPTITVYRLSR